MLFVFICSCFDISCLFCPRQQVHDYITFLILMLVFGLFAPVCLHLHYRTPFRHSPPLCYFSLSSLTSTEDQQDRMHKGFHLGNQPVLNNFATASSSKYNPVCSNLKTRNLSLDPRRLREMPQLESLTMSLTYGIAREPVKHL